MASSPGPRYLQPLNISNDPTSALKENSPTKHAASTFCGVFTIFVVMPPSQYRRQWGSLGRTRDLSVIHDSTRFSKVAPLEKMADWARCWCRFGWGGVGCKDKS